MQCINGVSSNPVEGRTNILQLKDLILTLFGLIFRRISYLVLTSLRDKVTLRLLKLYFNIVDVVEGAGRKAKRMVLQCINGVGSNPVEGRTKI
jgi:hypothetical protein